MFDIELSHTAEKELRRLPKRRQMQLIGALEMLSEDPYSGKPLQGELKGLWSLCVWPYRIIYKIDKGILTIVVIAIKHRQGAYKK